MLNTIPKLLRLAVRGKEHDSFWVGKQFYDLGAFHYKLLDDTYYVPPRSSLWLLNALNFGRHLKWVKDSWDCDDYASAFKVLMNLTLGVNAVGMVVGPDHTWNVVVTETGVVTYEPQTGEWVEATGRYSLPPATISI